jgi:polysaccharide transporter, PST family
MNFPLSENPLDVALDGSTLTRKTVRGSIATAVAQALKTAFQFGSQLFLARFLFPADFGLVAMAAPVLGFIQTITDIGLGQAIIQRPSLTQGQVSAVFWFNMALSLCTTALFLILSPVVAWAFGEPRLLTLMLGMSSLILLSALSIHPVAILSRRMQFGTIAKCDLAASVSGILVTVIGAWAGWGYWSLVAGQAVSTSFNCLLCWIGCRWRPSKPAFHAEAWADLRFGGNLTVANLATYLTTTADNIIVGFTTGAASLGVYDRSYRLVVQPIGQMISPISRVAVPYFSRLNSMPDEYRRAYSHALRTVLLLTLPLMLVCISNAKALILVLLGQRWAEAIPVFSWICVGGLASPLYASTYWLFISQARTRELMMVTSIISAINVAAFIIGSRWGVVGIAAGAALSFVFVCAPLMIVCISRRGPIRASNFAMDIWPQVASGALTYALLERVESFFEPVGIGGIVGLTAISYTAFSVSVLLLPGGRKYLNDTIRLTRSQFKAFT